MPKPIAILTFERLFQLFLRRFYNHAVELHALITDDACSDSKNSPKKVLLICSAEAKNQPDCHGQNDGTENRRRSQVLGAPGKVMGLAADPVDDCFDG